MGNELAAHASGAIFALFASVLAERGDFGRALDASAGGIGDGASRCRCDFSFSIAFLITIADQSHGGDECSRDAGAERE